MPLTSPQALQVKPFFFGSRSTSQGRLHFRKTYNNVFVTFTDLSNKVVATMSGGQCFQGNKRPKKAPQVLEPMVAMLYPSFQLHRITFFEI